jgi:hypothetical protein
MYYHNGQVGDQQIMAQLLCKYHYGGEIGVQMVYVQLSLQRHNQNKLHGVNNYFSL